ncbi:MAG: DUF1285 domain-containing protein [Pseudomonadota bacterium]
MRENDFFKGVAAAAGSDTGLPPVHLWNPPFCGDIDMRIAADGVWFYNGTPIGRPAMVRLFSRILRKDEDRYVLVTPVEKVGVQVDDAPFVATSMTVSGAGRDQALHFVTNVGDAVEASGENRIRVELDEKTGAPRPYVHVRAGLEALIARAVFYDMFELGVEEMTDEGAMYGVWSAGVFFPFIAAEALAS